jgi:hypothetical protein
LFEHRNRALPAWTFRSDAAINRQRAEQRQKHQNKSRNRRERARREKSNSRLIAECRKVIDARQTHHFPPRMRVMFAVLFRRRFVFLNALQQPMLKAIIGVSFYFFHIFIAKNKNPQRRAGSRFADSQIFRRKF